MSNASRAQLNPAIALPGSTILAQALWIVVFAVLTAAGARLEIPHQPVPYTLQTLVVLLAGAFLGSRNGALSQMLYIGAGILGAPVFAGGAFGLTPFFGPSGGYLLAFPLAAAVVGALAPRGRSLAWAVVSMTAGLLVIFTSGTLYLYAKVMHDIGSAFASGFLIFSWWDMLKLGAASMIYFEASKKRK